MRSITELDTGRHTENEILQICPHTRRRKSTMSGKQEKDQESENFVNLAREHVVEQLDTYLYTNTFKMLQQK